MEVSPNVEGTIKIGTRASRLARWQAEWVAERLRTIDNNLNVDLVEIKTLGDRDRNSPLAAIGGMGLFTKEIQRALKERSVDVAVHSLKDLPTEHVAGLVLAAVPAREDVADALIAPRYRTIESLPKGASVGTSSPRRRAQLLYLRPDLDVVSLRGNVETRLRQALEGHLDAVILAWAGLHRLGLEQHVTQRLDPATFLPAVGQGALGIECRCDDGAMTALLAHLNDAITYRAVIAERAALAAMQGGCNIPMAAWAREIMEDEDKHVGSTLVIDAAVFDFDGRSRVAVALQGDQNAPESLGHRAAQALLDNGATALLDPKASVVKD